VTDPVNLVDASYAAARWGWYLAVFLVVGAGSYAPFFFRLPSLTASHPGVGRELTRRAARLGFGAAIALLLLAMLRLYLQARTLNDPAEPLTTEFFRAVLGTRWGKGWQYQTGMGILALIGFTAARGGKRWGWLLGLASCAGLGLTAGITGHASSAKSGSLGLLLDGAHLLAGALWLGGLAVLFVAGLGACTSVPAAERPAVLGVLVAGFSRRALIVAPLTVALGIWLAARYLGWVWPLHLFESGYGWVLAAKLAALAGVGALGAYNWRITQPGLSKADGEARLRRCSALELWFGVILLGLTAVLVALPFPEGRM
jgi:putative copper export protein